MASSSVKSEIFGGGETESMEGFLDRFSSLPDKIAHHILDFLDVVDLSQLMLASKRCKQFCMSVPVLWLDNKKYTCDVASLHHYMRLVGNFLSLRHQTRTKVCQFNFTWQWHTCEQTETTKKRKRKIVKKVEHNKELFYQVHEYFMKTVSCCDTESLHLGLMSPELKPQQLHPFFFDITKNLKELTVRTNNCSLGFCETSFETFPKLEKLTLLYSELKDSEISWVVFHLPSLKALCLHCCTGLKKLILKSKSLEHFRIFNDNPVELEELFIYCSLQTLFVKWYPYSDASPAFGIVSSQLKEFVWHGLPLGYYFADRSVHLQKAAIHLLLPSKRLQWELSDASTGLLDDVIDQLKMTKSVTFHANTIRLFHMNDCLSSPLSKVESLAIEYCTLTDKLVPPIAFFLQGMLDLKSLSITSRVPRKQVEEVVERFGPSMEGLKGFDMEYWEAQGLKFVPQLKNATIEVHLGNGVELVKYLLKHAAALETLNILCFRGMESSILELIKEYKSQLTTVLFSSI